MQSDFHQGLGKNTLNKSPALSTGIRPGSEILLKTEVWSNLIFLGFIACAARYSMWTMAVETIVPVRTC